MDRKETVTFSVDGVNYFSADYVRKTVDHFNPETAYYWVEEDEIVVFGPVVGYSSVGAKRNLYSSASGEAKLSGSGMAVLMMAEVGTFVLLGTV